MKYFFSWLSFIRAFSRIATIPSGCSLTYLANLIVMSDADLRLSKLDKVIYGVSDDSQNHWSIGFFGLTRLAVSPLAWGLESDAGR